MALATLSSFPFLLDATNVTKKRSILERPNKPATSPSQLSQLRCLALSSAGPVPGTCDNQSIMCTDVPS